MYTTYNAGIYRAAADRMDLDGMTPGFKAVEV
jgi:hypothetical protein